MPKMTRKDAELEARRRWGNGDGIMTPRGFARWFRTGFPTHAVGFEQRAGGPGKPTYSDRGEYWKGEGRSWEEAFADADRKVAVAGEKVLLEDRARTGPDRSSSPLGEPDADERRPGLETTTGTLFFGRGEAPAEDAGGPCCEGPCEHEAEAAEDARRAELASKPLPEPLPKTPNGLVVIAGGDGPTIATAPTRRGFNGERVVAPTVLCACPEHDNPHLEESKACSLARARELAAAPDLAAALREMVLCFGKGEESEAWWRERAEEAAASDSPGSAEEVRASVLEFARTTYAAAYAPPASEPEEDLLSYLRPGGPSRELVEKRVAEARAVPAPHAGLGLHTYLDIGRAAQVRGDLPVAAAAFSLAVRFGRSREEKVGLAQTVRRIAAEWRNS